MNIMEKSEKSASLSFGDNQVNCILSLVLFHSKFSSYIDSPL